MLSTSLASLGIYARIKLPDSKICTSLILSPQFISTFEFDCLISEGSYKTCGREIKSQRITQLTILKNPVYRSDVVLTHNLNLLVLQNSH